MSVFLIFLLLPFIAAAKPYHLPEKVISPLIQETKIKPIFLNERSTGPQLLRVEVDWNENETFRVSGSFLENSGTPGLLKASTMVDPLGSYKAQLLISTDKGVLKLYSSIGTGKEFRGLVRTLSFRFPFVQNALSYTLILEAEHPEKGLLQKVIEQKLDLKNIQIVKKQEVKVTLLKKSYKQPAIKVNFYAEGFSSEGEAKFLSAAYKAMTVLDQKIPGSEYFEYRGVFAPSRLKIGKAQDLKLPVEVRDSFLGLYFPYWRKFGRWYHVVYPTSETKYRNALAQEPYDYPLALVDDDGYWGVGNYKELTAIPAGSTQFSYLLLHEFGHFMGLNEEYEGGGPTELEFAPEIHEPWSQNITFNPNNLKWKSLTEPGIGLPTSNEDYLRFGGVLKNPVGAYRGGYADSLPKGKSHKPVKACMMASGGDFCKVCQDALLKVIEMDSGLVAPTHIYLDETAPIPNN